MQVQTFGFAALGRQLPSLPLASMHVVPHGQAGVGVGVGIWMQVQTFGFAALG
jgi:hypothetical protein